jgi:hypothetical protein
MNSRSSFNSSFCCVSGYTISAKTVRTEVYKTTDQDDHEITVETTPISAGGLCWLPSIASENFLHAGHRIQGIELNPFSGTRLAGSYGCDYIQILGEERRHKTTSRYISSALKPQPHPRQ